MASGGRSIWIENPWRQRNRWLTSTLPHLVVYISESLRNIMALSYRRTGSIKWSYIPRTTPSSSGRWCGSCRDAWPCSLAYRYRNASACRQTGSAASGYRITRILRRHRGWRTSGQHLWIRIRNARYSGAICSTTHNIPLKLTSTACTAKLSACTAKLRQLSICKVIGIWVGYPNRVCINLPSRV